MAHRSSLVGLEPTVVSVSIESSDAEMSSTDKLQSPESNPLGNNDPEVDCANVQLALQPPSQGVNGYSAADGPGVEDTLQKGASLIQSSEGHSWLGKLRDSQHHFLGFSTGIFLSSFPFVSAQAFDMYNSASKTISGCASVENESPITLSYCASSGYLECNGGLDFQQTVPPVNFIALAVVFVVLSTSFVFWQLRRQEVEILLTYGIYVKKPTKQQSLLQILSCVLLCFSYAIVRAVYDSQPPPGVVTCRDIKIAVIYSQSAFARINSNGYFIFFKQTVLVFLGSLQMLMKIFNLTMEFYTVLPFTDLVERADVRAFTHSAHTFLQVEEAELSAAHKALFGRLYWCKNYDDKLLVEYLIKLKKSQLQSRVTKDVV